VLFFFVLCLVPGVACVFRVSILDCLTSFLCCVIVLFFFVLCLVPGVACVFRVSILDCLTSFLCCVIVLFFFVLCLGPGYACVFRVSILDCPISFHQRLYNTCCVFENFSRFVQEINSLYLFERRGLK
jgi:hypothetical protein